MAGIVNEGGNGSGLIESESRKRRLMGLLTVGDQLIEAMTESSVEMRIARQRVSRKIILEPVSEGIKFFRYELDKFRKQVSADPRDADVEALEKLIDKMQILADSLDLFLRVSPKIRSENPEVALLEERIKKLTSEFEKLESGEEVEGQKEIDAQIDGAIEELLEVYKIYSAASFEELYVVIQNIKKLRLHSGFGVDNEAVVREIKKLEEKTRTTRTLSLDDKFIKALSSYTLRVKIRELMTEAAGGRTKN